MRLRLLVAALLTTSAVSAAPPANAPTKNPIAREWMMVLTTKTGAQLGLDPKSFKVVSPGDLFTFDTLVIFGKDDAAQLGSRRAAAHVSTIKASCAKKQAQVVADTLHDDSGAVVAVNEAAKIDKMEAVSGASFVGRVVELVCAGKPLFQSSPGTSSLRGA